MTGLTWLHLSDWHQKGMEFDRQVVLDALLKDIRNRTVISPELAKIDFIVFSGDVAYSGQNNEYEIAKKELFDPLLKASGENSDKPLRRDRLFIVPGNHDLDRNVLEKLPDELSKPFKSEELVQVSMEDVQKRVILLKPFAAFKSFVNSYTGQDQPDYANIQRLEIDCKKIALVGLNSAWSCGRNKDPEGIVHDEGFVFVGEPQIYYPLNQISDAEIKIAVLHHSMDWLAVYERMRIKGHLMRQCDFILYGHGHMPEVTQMHSTFGDCVFIPAGASYDRRIAKDPHYTNAYNFVHLDFETGKGIVFLRRWSDPRYEWIEDVDSHPCGKFEFTLPVARTDIPISYTGRILLSTNHQNPFVPLQKPIRPMNFIGREREIETLLKVLKPGSIVALCGPAGVGKTALAKEAIWLLAPGCEPPERFPDGIVFHTFYHQPQSALALEAIARAYGEDPLPSSVDAARRALAGRRALLVLDGSEETDNLGAVLDVAGSCGVLITTRRHSDAPSDCIELAPLPQDQAVKLLQELGRDYATNRVASDRICELVGRLPLAVFLAGRQLAQRHQCAEDYLSWLEASSLAALDLGERQHQSIPMLMEHNLSQVSELARAALSIAGVLALEPFDLELITTALKIHPQEAGRGLGELVNYGLLLQHNARYQVVHALTHTYARKRLPPKRDDLVRLAEYYCVFASEQSCLGPHGYDRLEFHKTHILSVQSACLAANEWEAVRNLALAIKDYLDMRGMWAERVSVAEAGLFAARADGTLHDEVNFLTILGNTYGARGEYRRAIVYHEKSLEISHNIGYLSGEGTAFGNLGLANYFIGEYIQAIELHEKSLEIANKIGNLRGKGAALGNLGLAYSRLGKTRKAIEFYEKSLAIERQINNLRGEGATLGNLGAAYLVLGEHIKAIEFFKWHLTIAKKLATASENAENWESLASPTRKLGEYEKAIEFFKQHLTIAREIGDQLGEGNALWNMSLTLDKINKRSEAIEYAKSALEIYEQIESPRAEQVRRQIAEWQSQKLKAD